MTFTRTHKFPFVDKKPRTFPPDNLQAVHQVLFPVRGGFALPRLCSARLSWRVEAGEEIGGFVVQWGGEERGGEGEGGQYLE
jgi:hypothetical protein